MLDDFVESQKIVCRTLINSFKRKRFSHAYLIETNGYSKSFEFVLSIAKSLLCPYNYTNKISCNCCNQCKLIDNNNFLELKIIKPNGEWIKKEQLDELQLLFSKKAIVGNKKVYIIDGVEKLNNNSANSILKFLEEPEDGIFALLITENLNNVLSTIVSRCQIFSLKNVVIKKYNSTLEAVANNIFNNENDIVNFIDNENSNNIINNVVNFVHFYEDNKLDTILNIENIWNCFFKDRKEIGQALDIMILYYNDILNYLMNNDVEIFTDYKKNINTICLKNSIKSISKKITVIMDLKQKIKYNINTNLLMDKLLISLEGCD